MLNTLIPYVRMPEHTIADLPLIGPLKLQVFGPLVAVGVILGMRQCLRYAKTRDIDEYIVRDLMFWVLVVGFVVSHWVSVLFYFPDQVKENPWVLLMIWNGLSSVGGFFGAFLGMVFYLRKMKQPILPYADLLIFGLLIGWCFGRLGCTLVHDHPGVATDPGFPLAVGPFPDGSYRHDMGLYEFLFTVPLTIYVYRFFPWQTVAPGRLVGLVTVLYAPLRFVFDFLREVTPSRGVISEPDIRYMGLTAAQWFTIVFFFAGVYLLLIRRPRESDLAWARDSACIARDKAAEGASASGSGAPASASGHVPPTHE